MNIFAHFSKNLPNHDGPRPHYSLHILVIILILTCLYFWLFSRYPQLNIKELMGSRTLTDSLSFSSLLETPNSDHNFLRILKVSINWLYTNYQGMTFGLLLSSILFSILQLINIQKIKSTFLKSLFGTILGIPMGVCANCAAPISMSMKKGSINDLTSITLAVSSPSLNLIVLSLMLQILPTNFLIGKIIFTLFLIFIILPFIFGKESNDKEENSFNFIKSKNNDRNILNALKYSLLLISHSFIYFFIRTFPLMVLASLLGAAMIQFLPIQLIQNIEFNILNSMLISLWATLLPLPMTFDIFFTFALYSSGLNPALCFIFLCAGGSYSIFTHLVFLKTFNGKKTWKLLFIIVLFSFSSGYLFHIISENDKKNIISNLSKKIIHYKKNEKERIQSTPEKCRLINDVVKQEQCERIIYRSFFNRSKKPKNCKIIKDKAQKKNCKIFSRSQRSMKKGIDPCKGKSCKEYRLLSLIENFNLDGLCARTQNSIYKSHCPQALKLNSILFYSSIDSCHKLSGDYKKLCYIFHSDQNSSDQFTQCNQLTNQSFRSVCYRNYLKGLKKKSKYPSCLKIKSPKQKLICLSLDPKQASLCDTRVCKVIQSLFDTSIPLSSSSLQGLKILPHKNYKEEFKYSTPKPISFTPVFNQHNIKISSSPYKTIHKKKFLLERLPLEKTGIESPDFNLMTLHQPFVRGRGMAAADYNQDGHIDIALATNSGIKLYLNHGDNNFKDSTPTYLKDGTAFGEIFLVSFIDINNDQKLDLFISPLMGEKIFLLNKDGLFHDVEVIRMPFNNEVVTRSAAFGDLNNDGNLEVFLGNWSKGFSRRTPFSKNYIYSYDKHFTLYQEYEDNLYGDSLTALISDIDGDQKQDLLVGNDWEASDQIFLSKGDAKKSGILKIPTFTMSYISADINNDLTLDLFASDIDFRQENIPNKCEDRDIKCQLFRKYYQKIRQGDLSSCSINPDLQDQCHALKVYQLADKYQSSDICHYIPKKFTALTALCIKRRVLNLEETPKIENDFEQVNRNIFYLNQKNNTFIEVAKEYGISQSYWSWNASFVDLDNDKYKDLIIVNSEALKPSLTPNVFYQNIKGKQFKNYSKKVGFNDSYNSSTFLQLDANNNGNRDLLLNGIDSSYRFYRNHSQNNSISFILINKNKNTYAIGAKVIIKDRSGDQQILEITQGGGFYSFNPYRLTFGLEDQQFISQLTVIWPDGKKTLYEKPLKSGFIYKIERQ